VRTIDPNGSLEFVHVEGPSAKVVRRIPVEAEARDEDGTVIHVLVHVLDGKLNELEIYREDSGTVVRKPAPEQLRLIVL
jgi:putative aminopeptidase FrvX